MADAATVAASQDQNYSDTPAGWKQRWVMEFNAARTEHEDWQKNGQDIVERFLDKRKGKSNMPDGISTRWNFYTANVQTMEAMLYGKIPSVDVRPRFADAPDSEARVASELLERLLNSDIEREGDGFAEAVGLCLKDRLNPGLGFLRLRYVADWEKVEGKSAQVGDDGTELAPEVPEYDKKSKEEVETDYVFWKDVLWSPCRVFHDMRWCAFASDLSKKEFEKRFGAEALKDISFSASRKDDGGSDSKQNDPWQRVRVWEIWDKENKCVWFFSETAQAVLKPVDLDDAQFAANGSLEDPLGLDGFWPFPRPMVANLTTSAFLPRADYTLCQDLYEEIDRVSTRITELERAIGAKGVYDKNNEALKRLLTEDANNQMIPVESVAFAAMMEKGGLSSVFALMPLAELIGALDRLCEYRQELIQAAFQLTGMSDVVRGQASEAGATATEQSIKARFASVRMQAIQDELARFASDAQKIRAEIISKHFDAQTILERSNIQHSFDAGNLPLVLKAVELIKSDSSCYRVEVKPESISLTDLAAMKSERMEVLASLGAFIQSAAPFMQMAPGALPYLLKLLQFALASMRGSQEIAGVLDQAVANAQQAAQQQQQQPQGQQGPDPRMLAQQAKTQGDVQKIQAQTQAEQIGRVQETEQMNIRAQNSARVDIQKEAIKQRIKHQQQPAGPLPGPGNGGVT